MLMRPCFRSGLPHNNLLRKTVTALAFVMSCCICANAQVVLVVEDTASIYRSAAQGFKEAFENPAVVETIYTDASGKGVNRVLMARQVQSPQLIVAIGTQAALAARAKFPSIP